MPKMKREGRAKEGRADRQGGGGTMQGESERIMTRLPVILSLCLLLFLPPIFSRVSE